MIAHDDALLDDVAALAVGAIGDAEAVQLKACSRRPRAATCRPKRIR